MTNLKQIQKENRKLIFKIVPKYGIKQLDDSKRIVTLRDEVGNIYAQRAINQLMR